MASMCKFWKWRPTQIPYVLLVSNDGGFEKVRTYFRHGMYWIIRHPKAAKGRWYPLRKSMMCHTAHELVERNLNIHSGALIDKNWAPLTSEMLAWYNMLPDDPPEATDPQMAE